MPGVSPFARVALRACAFLVVAVACGPVLAAPDPPPGKPPARPAGPGQAGGPSRWIRFGPPGNPPALDAARVVRAQQQEISIEGEALRRFLAGEPPRSRWTLFLDEPGAVALAVTVDRPRLGEDIRSIPVLGAADSRLDPLRIDVVDAVSGKPVPGATLHLFPMSDAPRVIRADAAGRIEVRDADSAREPGRRLLARLARSGSCVRAPGRAPHEWGGWSPFVDPAPAARVVYASDLVALESRGALVARLHPLEQGLVDRRARLLDAAGLPVLGAGVDVTGPGRADQGPIPVMPATYGLQATDAEGGFDVPRAPIVVVDVRRRGVPLAVFAVDSQGEGPLDLRLPPVAEATIVIDGVPAGGAHWSFDRSNRARVPVDGPVLPTTFGPSVEADLRRRGLRVCCAQFDAAGLLPAGTAELRVPVPVGVPRTLWIGPGPWPSADEAPPEDRVTLEILAKDPGELRIERVWTDLPKAR